MAKGDWARVSIMLPAVLLAGITRASDLPPALPDNVPSADVTGVWEFIPVPLPEQNITHLLLAREKDRLYLGTREGVASYDGVTVRVPEFSPKEAGQSLIVSSMAETDNGTIIVGTANDSLWTWKDDRLSPLYGACPRGSGGCPTGDWALALKAGTVFAASSRYAPNETEALDAIKGAVSEAVVPVAVSASFLGFAGESLVAVGEQGAVSIIDQASGKASRTWRFDAGANSFVRSVSFAPGYVFAGTDTKCVAVPLDDKQSPIELAPGNCTAVYRQADGTTWLSTKALYRTDMNGWTEWSPGGVRAILANALLDDGLSNVWIASTGGLWRYLDLSRQYRFVENGDYIASLHAAPDGGVYVGMLSGKVWRVDRQFKATLMVSPPTTAKPTSAYYEGALLAAGANGEVWSLSAGGLFRIDERGATQVAPYPLPIDENPRAVSSLAVSSEGKICAGLTWSTEVLCLKNGKWETALETLPYFGGSSVGALAFDDRGSLLAVGPVSLSVKGKEDLTLGPFEPSPFGKVNLFGAVTTLTSVSGANAVVSGGWGRTIFLKRSNGTWSTVGRKTGNSQDQPYLIQSFADHPRLGLMAGTDYGVYVWQGSAEIGHWRSLRDVDPRLGGWVSNIVPGQGKAFWISSGATLTLVTLPDAAPAIEIVRLPSTDIIDHNAVAYRMKFPGLIGLPGRKFATLAYDPPIANAESRIAGPTARLDLTSLDDLQSYRLEATVTDGFLNTGKSVADQFTVRLPFYQNPYKLSLALLALVAALALLVTRRGPTYFLLRRIGGLRWSTAKADPQFAMEIHDIGGDMVRFELEAPAARTLIKIATDLPQAQVEGLPKEALPFLLSIAEGQAYAEREEFEAALQRVADVLHDEALPASVRFATSQLDQGTMSVDVSKTLIWYPVELARDGHAEPLLLRYAIGRTVSGDTLADADGLQASRLIVAVVAPQLDPNLPQLPHVKEEAVAVANAARAWGAEVILVDPAATKAEVLDALCGSHLFHYAGHAEFDPLDAADSFLPLLNDRLTAQEVAEALATRANNLLFAFINGCGTSRETSWERADEVYGFASAFLNNASYFIGSQWPIQDEFAAPFAAAFYRQLFPTSYGLWWRLIRRDELSGLSFAEALRRARHAVREMSSSSDQTWSSYVFYGDPTRRLVLA
ncbi:CHAT domain-containing protein [Sinorhizobium meliloti]|uniref:CHAT domain-containing protein n=1 Tax=Rhizobium meliloti TaxID=382 RepID=UPI000FD24E90|nr:CHAT domain-containing protein [Sinorhizobium meliloti]RVH09634.1 CHAT domain-containing protein [Sinorhizobium meliloti]RVI15026.1 CHAT domain-containing protein [Sinorhizobium meliloti]